MKITIALLLLLLAQTFSEATECKINVEMTIEDADIKCIQSVAKSKSGLILLEFNISNDGTCINMTTSTCQNVCHFLNSGQLHVNIFQCTDTSTAPPTSISTPVTTDNKTGTTSTSTMSHITTTRKADSSTTYVSSKIAIATTDPPTATACICEGSTTNTSLPALGAVIGLLVVLLVVVTGGWIWTCWLMRKRGHYNTITR